MEPVQKFLTSNYNLGNGYAPISSHKFSLESNAWLRINGVIHLKHRGVYYSNFSGPVGWGIRGAIRGPTSESTIDSTNIAINVNTPTVGAVGSAPAVWIKGMTPNGNLTLDEHYVNAPLSGHIYLTPPGTQFYRFELWGAFHPGSVDYYAMAAQGMSPSHPDWPYMSGVEVNDAGGVNDPYSSYLLTWDMT